MDMGPILLGSGGACLHDKQGNSGESFDDRHTCLGCVDHHLSGDQAEIDQDIEDGAAAIVDQLFWRWFDEEDYSIQRTRAAGGGDAAENQAGDSGR